MKTNIRPLRVPDGSRSPRQVREFAPHIQDLNFVGVKSLSFEQPLVPLSFKNVSDDLFYSPSDVLSFEPEGESTPWTLDTIEQTRLNFKSCRIKKAT